MLLNIFKILFPRETMEQLEKSQRQKCHIKTVLKKTIIPHLGVYRVAMKHNKTKMMQILHCSRE